ncbi:MAG: VOC family protein [Deltaproteobacteria bacterium]|nr:VOC family protein [Deltaproteobacteria bacterium]
MSTDELEGEPLEARHVLSILAVEDLQQAVAWYRAAFGFPVRVDTPAYVELALPDGRGIGLYRREGFGKNTGQVPMAVPAGEIVGTELYFHVSNLEAAVTRLTEAGGRLLSAAAPRDWGDEAAYFADPDGNVIVVAKPLPTTDSA